MAELKMLHFLMRVTKIDEIKMSIYKEPRTCGQNKRQIDGSESQMVWTCFEERRQLH